MKTNKNIEYWDLIAKYYSNECSQQEINDLLNWKSESVDNQILFNQVKEDLEIIKINQSMNKINVDSAWEKLRTKIQEDEQSMPIKLGEKSKMLTFPAFIKYAAAIIILVSVGFFSTNVFNKISNKTEIIEFASINEQSKEIELPDGSTVILNANSKISFPDMFASAERRIKLEGEAFFDVTKNPEKPFIIEVKDAEVKVLGTSFNVNASIPGSEIEVFVQTGLVQLQRKKNSKEKILINPGDIGILDEEELTMEKNKNKNIVAWKTKEIVFIEDSMKNVIETLNKVYNYDISCEDQEILKLRYTSTFENEEIDSILKVICLSLDLKIENVDNKIFLLKHSI